MNGNRSSSESSTSLLADGERAGLPAGNPAGGTPAGLPPASNTGGKLTSGEGVEVGRVKVDWLTITYPAAARGEVIAVVSEVMGQGQGSERGQNLYAESWRWATGAVLAFSDQGVNADTCCLTLSGSVVDYFTPEGLLRFMKWSDERGGRCSRLDLAFDDLSRRVLRMEDVHAAAAAGNFSGFRNHTENVKRTRRGRLVGDLHSFGQRGKNGGGRYVRFYDKTLESDGQIDAVRMEVEFSGKKSREAFKLLAQAEDLGRFTSQIAGLIGGSIRFIDRRDGETHLERCSALSWWLAVVELLGSVRVVVRRAAPPLQRAMEYVRDAWSVNFALTFEVAESQGRDGEAAIFDLLRLMVRAGKAKLDAGYRPGVKSLGLEFGRLLAP